MGEKFNVSNNMNINFKQEDYFQNLMRKRQSLFSNTL